MIVKSVQLIGALGLIVAFGYASATLFYYKLAGHPVRGRGPSNRCSTRTLGTRKLISKVFSSGILSGDETETLIFLQ